MRVLNRVVRQVNGLAPSLGGKAIGAGTSYRKETPTTMRRLHPLL